MSESAFGVDHGHISKRERSTKEGAKKGALIGLGATAVHAGLSGGRMYDYSQAAKRIGHSRGRIAGTLAGATAAGAVVDAGVGAGIGAAIGAKKKPVIGGANGA